MIMVIYFNVTGLLAIPVDADHDKPKEGTAQTTFERNEHEQGTATAHKGRIIDQVNYLGIDKSKIFLLAL
ncbi:hypothetical protein HF086_004434 [Spodoptera exigua]|uniref:Uncharacterized protein n=1 Tax=Spodoptera exigua TaxID=7107 RepID=A0A922MDK7_SPOEX|nr:hypothetical protein HF086_004434 [Spodoptera exigua]